LEEEAGLAVVVLVKDAVILAVTLAANLVVTLVAILAAVANTINIISTISVKNIVANAIRYNQYNNVALQTNAHSLTGSADKTDN
jgi:hypothetical protein